MKHIFNTLLFALLLSSTVFAQTITKDYSKLKLLDLDEMNQLMVDQVKASRLAKTPDDSLILGLTLLMSRSDEDGLRRKVLPTIKGEVDAAIGWAEALNRLANESINALKQETPGKPAHQVTHAIILENILSEIKPNLQTNEEFLKIATKISEAKIKMSDEANTERAMTVMQKNKSPSETASDLLKNLNKK